MIIHVVVVAGSMSRALRMRPARASLRVCAPAFLRPCVSAQAGTRYETTSALLFLFLFLFLFLLLFSCV